MSVVVTVVGVLIFCSILSTLIFVSYLSLQELKLRKAQKKGKNGDAGTMQSKASVTKWSLKPTDQTQDHLPSYGSTDANKHIGIVSKVSGTLSNKSSVQSLDSDNLIVDHSDEEEQQVFHKYTNLHPGADTSSICETSQDYSEFAWTPKPPDNQIINLNEMIKKNKQMLNKERDHRSQSETLVRDRNSKPDEQHLVKRSQSMNKPTDDDQQSVDLKEREPAGNLSTKTKPMPNLSLCNVRIDVEPIEEVDENHLDDESKHDGTSEDQTVKDTDSDSSLGATVTSQKSHIVMGDDVDRVYDDPIFS